MKNPLKLGDTRFIWIVSTAVLGILLVVSIFTNSFGITGITGSTTKDNIKIDVESYLESSLGGDVEVLEVDEISGVYKVKFRANGGEIKEVFVSKDGELMFLNFVQLYVSL